MKPDPYSNAAIKIAVEFVYLNDIHYSANPSASMGQLDPIRHDSGQWASRRSSQALPAAADFLPFGGLWLRLHKPPKGTQQKLLAYLSIVCTRLGKGEL